MKKLLPLLACLVVLFYGCKTDFDVNATWKETTVIYGLLDQSQAVQMIKINKAFLGEGDANQFAQIADSINYDPKDIEVHLFELKNGVVKRTIPFHDSIILNKKPGDFTTEKNIIYVSSAKLDSTCSYKLEVKNLKTGNVSGATTPLLEQTKYSKPVSNFISFVSVSSTPTSNGAYSDLTTSWTTKPNAKTFQTNIRFYYIEKDLLLNQKTVKYIDWLQGAKQSSNTEGGEQIIQTISGQGFYQLLANEIPVNPNVERVDSCFILTMTVGSDELNTYINVNSPSSDLNQEKPIYTNIDNGFGIFSSRTSYRVAKYFCFDNVGNGCGAGSGVKSLDELVKGKYTYKLNFKYH